MQPENFWGEIAPCEHLVQIYEEDDVFLDTLQGFVVGGLQAGDGVIVIATAPHLLALDERLALSGCDLDGARLSDQYIALDAERMLERFMVNNWPDDARFEQTILQLLERARGPGRRVRAFGEMVAILWASGHAGATVRLEHLWREVCHQHSLPLFCAYPKSGFTQNAELSVREICQAHSCVIDGRKPGKPFAEKVVPLR